MIFGITIKDVLPECEKSISFSCPDVTNLFIDSEQNGKIVEPGQHEIKIKRHHDFFFDWSVDGNTVEEFLVFNTLTDNETCVTIRSDKRIDVEDQQGINTNADVFCETPFPIKLPIKDVTKFTIKCDKGSQLSIFFKSETDEESFETLTLVFENDYCKVFRDSYRDKKYVPDLRENLTLFKTKIGIDNRFSLSRENGLMLVENEILEEPKAYDIKGVFEHHETIEIDETWMPNGKGIYIIEEM